jgi:hypothetical protein
VKDAANLTNVHGMTHPYFRDKLRTKTEGPEGSGAGTAGNQSITAAQHQRRRQALRGFNTGPTYSEDTRREKPIAITCLRGGSTRGTTFDGAYWVGGHTCTSAGVSRTASASLAHQHAIRGGAESKDECALIC